MEDIILSHKLTLLTKVSILFCLITQTSLFYISYWPIENFILRWFYFWGKGGPLAFLANIWIVWCQHFIPCWDLWRKADCWPVLSISVIWGQYWGQLTRTTFFHDDEKKWPFLSIFSVNQWHPIFDTRLKWFDQWSMMTMIFNKNSNIIIVCRF